MFPTKCKQVSALLLMILTIVTASTLVLSQTTASERMDSIIFRAQGTASPTAFKGEHTVSFVQGGTAADALDTIFFIADRPYTVTKITAVWGTAESTGSMDIQVERLQGTEACTGGAGDDLLSAVIAATGTANTVNTGALVTTSVVDLAAGNRLCLNLSATPNEVVNMVVTVTVQPD